MNIINKIINQFISKKFLKFFLFSSLAAFVNIGSRTLLGLFLNYKLSIVSAYFLGMCTAFLLNKYFNFKDHIHKGIYQAMGFIVINLLGLLQTFIVSLLLADIVFYNLGVGEIRFFFAHIIGVGAPVITSFIGHKYITFGKYNIESFFKKRNLP